ncbi:MAG: futalosine hydrolase [Phycisphaeraceae bacterium]|nr:futalosine hydrolase [Phycisphaeraceae bacterium]
MHEELNKPNRPWLLVVAAKTEAIAVLRGVESDGMPPPEWRPTCIHEGLDLVVTGVGKANAAAGTALALCSRTYSAVVNLGIAGALPHDAALSIGDTVAATRSVYADEGVQLPSGQFVGCSNMGFPLGPFDDTGVPASALLLDRFRSHTMHLAPVATVSTCSGTNALALSVYRRTNAAAEAMEGAAVGQVCARLGVAFIELRVVSNTTGDRDKQVWDIQGAFSGISRLASVIARSCQSV